MIEYLMKYCSNYFDYIEDSALCYQIEYLLNYENNDVNNLRGTIEKILLIREFMNCIYLMSDEVKMSQIKTCANVIASIIMQPEIQPALEIIIIGSWAYVEALSDGKDLLNNQKVAVIKTKETWRTDIKYLWNKKEMQ